MTAHKNAAMIKAKADNMELVVFVKCGKNNKWKETKTPVQFPLSEFDDVDYFLCLPQHNENGQCLHWLNGGEVEFKDKNNGSWNLYICTRWALTVRWMLNDVEIRIKPRKEKRWIAINVKDGDVCMCHETAIPAPGYQIKEIEVEV